MNSAFYKSFYDQVGPINGWDFSRVQCVTEGVQWNFYDEVVRVCGRADLLLDIGTGGGEALLSIAAHALLLIGIDSSPGMIRKAESNRSGAGAANVRFLHMDAQKLEFPESFFQVISCRHSSFYAKEMARVLESAGIFLTQQVAENDKGNLKEAFGRGQAYGCEEGALQAQYEAELSEAGFSDIRTFEYNADEYYETPEDLIFLLKHTPIIPEFGQTAADFELLRQFIADNRTAKGIRTNAHRFMITARK